jgi:hypothetical protein
LGEIVFCLCAPGLVLDCFERGEEQANQNRNDCDDNEEFNEGEGAWMCSRGTHGANAKRKLPDAHVKCLERLRRLPVCHVERSETSLVVTFTLPKDEIQRFFTSLRMTTPVMA